MPNAKERDTGWDQNWKYGESGTPDSQGGRVEVSASAPRSRKARVGGGQVWRCRAVYGRQP